MHLLSPSSVINYLVAIAVVTRVPASAYGQSFKNYGNSKVVLYQGNTRYEIDSSFCTVGVAFRKPERFSCACVNGIWAFYGDKTCGPPLALVAGNNYCFQMPNVPIREVTSISSPMRALSSSLTILEPNLDSVKTKIYRNIHMAVDRRSQYVALNSSWTLLSPRGDEGVCLLSKSEEEPDDSGPLSRNTFFCSFANVSDYLIRVASVEKGCTNESFPMIEPINCLPILEATSEDICRSSETLEAFKVPIPEDLAEEEELDFFRHIRSNSRGSPMRNIFNEKPTTTTTTTTTTQRTIEQFTTTVTTSTTEEPSTTIAYPEGYEDAPLWLQKVIREGMENGMRFDKVKSHGRSMKGSSSSGGPPKISPAERTEIMSTTWSEFQTFLSSANRRKATSNSTISESIDSTSPVVASLPTSTGIQNTTVTSQLVRYMEKIMRAKLRLKSSKQMSDDTQVPKTLKLLYIAKDVVKKLCPLLHSDYFDMVVSMFTEIQLKFFRWTESHLKTLDFKRVQGALVACRENSKPIVKVNKCPHERKGTTETPLSPSGEGLLVPMELPEALRAQGKEPIIETAWKIFISVHSYCYKFFDHYYNDHHKFTTLMYPLFSNNIQTDWFRNLTAEDFYYSSIIGDVNNIWEGIDKCAMAAREASTYPFHLTRPSLLADSDKTYKGLELDSEKPNESSRRKRRAVESDFEADDADEDTSKIGLSDEASDVLQSDSEYEADDPWKIERRVLDGKGFCLKKYNEAKTHLGYGCGEKDFLSSSSNSKQRG